MPMTREEAAEERRQLIESLWAGRVRELLSGEELPPLDARLIPHGKHDDAVVVWREMCSWVSRHG